MIHKILLALATVTTAFCSHGMGADYSKSYAVVVSKKTSEIPEWKLVVDTLVKKHDASVIVYDEDVDHCTDDLRKSFPRYTCFVAQPDELGEKFVAHVHRLTRRLDDDPYTDTQWGIITGYTPADALRIAADDKPLVMKSVMGLTGVNLDLFEKGAFLSDGKAGQYEISLDGKHDKVDEEANADRTDRFRDAMQKVEPELIVTSGHATQRNLEMPFSKGNIINKDGKLFTVKMAAREAHEFQTTNRKVFMGVGNCLIGNVDRKDCMALALMGGGHVNQMVGYTVVTWFGKGGWGTLELLSNQPDRYNIADCFFFNQQSLINHLETNYPTIARKDFDIPDPMSTDVFVQNVAQTAGTDIARDKMQDAIGYSWDRDTVAFYGDPAWDARIDPKHTSSFTTAMIQKNRIHSFIITATRDTGAQRAVAQWFTTRLKNIKIIDAGGTQPVLTDNFVLIPQTPELKAGQTLTVTFSADDIP